jgi:COP9 signalosome complex subunit 1
MQSKALQTAREYEKELIDRIRRMNLAAADLEVKGPGRKGGNGTLPGLGEIFKDDNKRPADFDQPVAT